MANERSMSHREFVERAYHRATGNFPPGCTSGKSVCARK